MSRSYERTWDERSERGVRPGGRADADAPLGMVRIGGTPVADPRCDRCGCRLTTSEVSRGRCANHNEPRPANKRRKCDAKADGPPARAADAP